MRPARAKNIRAKLTLDPESVKRFNSALLHLRDAVRIEIVRQALAEGGLVIQNAAAQSAPGPYITTEVMTGSQLAGAWKGASAAGVKSDAIYAAVGPDRKHWYYRFAEYGTKTHVPRRKTTRFQQYSSRHGISLGKLRKSAYEPARRAAFKKPVMAWMSQGKKIFARQVRGMAARPFLRPAADSKRDDAMRAIIKTLTAEIRKEAAKEGMIQVKGDAFKIAKAISV